MTWAQGTFAYCFGILVPVVGVLSALRLRRERRPWFKGFIFASGAMFLALVFCCLIAKLCFPHYSNQHPPELIANAFTVPSVVAGIAVIWYVSNTRLGSRRFCTFASALVLVLYLGGLLLCYEAFTWSFRKALPWSAREVHESYMTDTLLPDYGYQLKARITEKEFRDYIARFDLTPHTATRTYSDDLVCLSWRYGPGFEGGWWDPSDSLDATFVWQGDTTWTFAKYEHGYLYLSSLCH